MRQENLFGDGRGLIGSDESGKGDFFGPLVVAAVYLPEGQGEVLQELGVKDSKKLTDKRINELAETIKKGYVHSIVSVGPQKYNELYYKLKNLNRLLAWAHSRAIENILEKVPCNRAMTDQFGNESYVLNALMKKGRTLELIQKPKAESEPAVAAASILARAEFLRRMHFLSQEIGTELPRGASPRVEEAAVSLVKKHGQEILDRLAKTHFKTTKRILEAVT